jgi:F-type H+-transporting ATPase subunit c
MPYMKIVKLIGVAMIGLLLVATPVLAQPKDQVAKDQAPAAGVTPPPANPWFSGSGFGAGLGMALTVIGAGYGMGRIGQAALESMARQPEVAPRIQTAMIIIAAMLEGATLASVIFCFIVGVAKATF